MRILLVNPNKVEREAHCKFLEAKHHHIECASDARAAIQLLEGGTFQSLYIDTIFVAEGAKDIIQAVPCPTPTATKPYVLLGIERAQVPFDELYALGVDDFIRRPLWKEELAARLETPSRVRRSGGNAADPLAQPGWADIPALIASSMASFASLEVDVDQPARPLQDAAAGATLSLTMPSHDAELRVVAIVNAISLRTLARHVLDTPTPSDELLQDLLGELANAAAGGLKRAAPDVELTTGLPALVPRAELGLRWERASVRVSLRFRDTPIAIAFAVSIVKQKTERLAASLLREGMILTKDLRNDAGLLLIPCGTRLTSTAAERVAVLLGGDRLVEIVAAA